MRCDEVRELVLSDYTDGELSVKRRSEIDTHVAGCAGCRELVKAVRERAVLPFKLTGEMAPPERVWTSVQTSIVRERLGMRRTWPLAVMRGLLSAPGRLAPAVAALFVIAIVFLMADRRNAGKREATDYISETSNFVSSLGSDRAGYKMTNPLDMGTYLNDVLL